MSRKGRRSKRYLRADEVTQLGPFTMARFGRLVTMKNQMSPAEFVAMKDRAAQALPEITADVDSNVSKLRQLIGAVKPVQLLQICYGKNFLSSLGKKAEPDFGFEDHIPGLTLLYVQNILAADKIEVGEMRDPQESDYDEISKCVTSIYSSLSVPYHIAASSFRAKKPDYWGDSFEEFYVQAQMYWTMVRKDRYTYHDIPFLRFFLSPHDEKLRQLYGISTHELLEGVDSIVQSLTRGIGRALKGISDAQEEAARRLTEGGGEKELRAALEGMRADPKWSAVLSKSFGAFLGTDLYDLSKVCKLPTKVLRDLSWRRGEETTYLSPGEHQGWPFRRSPVQQRPFIELDGTSYCFDYQPLVDGLYRFVQRKLTQSFPDYADAWKSKQQEVSESLPLSLFSALLPGSTTFRNARYQWPPTKARDRNWCEVDGLVLYDDVLIVVESKAGAFSYTSPTNDFDSHIASLRTLVEKPSQQAARFDHYLGSAAEVPIFEQAADGSFQEMRRLRKDSFRLIVFCGITLDNFSYLASRAEGLKALGVDLRGMPFWSLSVGDLLVYRDIFASPTCFAHFLRERQRAVLNKNFEAHDEIDHLGMYMAHNMYATMADDTPADVKRMGWHGYSSKIDTYFFELSAGQKAPERPTQTMPKVLGDIIRHIDINPSAGKCFVARQFLDLGEKARSGMADKFEEVLREQERDGRVKPFSFFQGSELSIACELPSIRIDEEVFNDYARSSLLWSKTNNRAGLRLEFDQTHQLTSVRWKLYSESDIPLERRAELSASGERLAKQRIERHRKQTMRRKIGRNERCPCGSGKKYKHCHGST